MKRILALIILCMMFSGCAGLIDMATCGDGGVCCRRGFLWQKRICCNEDINEFRGDENCE